MSLGTLLLGLALLIIVATVIGLPLLIRKSPFLKPLSRQDILARERRDVVRAIRELDFDFRTGKIGEEDYKRLRAAQVQRGADILRELDALAQPDRRDVDEEIEAYIARLRMIGTAPTVRRSSAHDGLTCPNCHHVVGAGDKFCPQCGYRLGAEGRDARNASSADAVAL